MTQRTRNFVIASLLVLGAGVGTGLAAYFGFSTRAFTAPGGPDELRFLPANVTVVAFANVHEVMTSELRQKLRTELPFQGRGQQSFQDDTGINIETDIDRVVFGLAPGDASGGHPNGLVIARGRFDVVKIERAMRDHGATVEEYKGKRIVTATRTPATDAPTPPPAPDGAAAQPPAPRAPRTESFSVAFVEPGLVAVGSSALVRHAVDLRDGGDSVIVSDDIMTRVRALESGNVWAVGRFDALTAGAKIGQGMMGQLPSIVWFSASGQVDSGFAASLKAETRDEESANGLRDVVRGFVALAKMQTASRPDVQPLLQSIQLGGSGQTVTLSLNLTPQTLDVLTSTLRRPTQPSR